MESATRGTLVPVILLMLISIVFSQVHLDEKCGEDILLRDAKTLTVANWTALRMRGTCSVSVTADPSGLAIQSGNRLMLTIVDLQTGQAERTAGPHDAPYFSGEATPCPAFRLDIFNADSKTRITPDGGVCEHHVTSKHMLSQERRASIVMTYNVTSNISTSHRQQLRLLAVRFHDNPCDEDKEFECDNARCVSSSLECNGQNDCGDQSDETDGCLLSTPVLVVIAVTSVVAIVAVIACAVILFKQSSSRRTGWGEARLMAGAGSINEDDWSERRHVTQVRYSHRPQQVYGATA